METLIYALRDNGVNVKVLTLCEKGDFHKELESNGVETFTLPVLSLRKNVINLVKFCKKHKISTVHSHLQNANIVAVFAQFLMKAKAVIFRHHFEMPMEGIERNKNELRGEKIINKLAKHIVVPSSGVFNGMRDFENANMNKVSIVPYIYNFDKYKKPNLENVESIRTQYSSKLLMLICSRHVPAKRHMLVFKALSTLIPELDLQLLVMDDGPERKNLELFVQDNKLSNNIHFIGFRKDFIDYFAAVDLLLHPSIIDASNSVVKEMALNRKPAITCSNIGDFSDCLLYTSDAADD